MRTGESPVHYVCGQCSVVDLERSIMSRWEPEDHDADPMVNAILNVADSLSQCANGISDLLYALKYSKQTGLSVAEAIEVAARTTSSSIEVAASELGRVADAIDCLESKK